ncbi:prenyltransferase [Flavobacterium sp. Sd200]|uniref:UbiA family prenyltransferase n=1 Tax=Flavobacterium sp. Sd200 TaxID=2692211 RepID=UPI001367BC9B|nr:UbiA family prenyltransferase [Flavobacterium sp. Sd200]MXN90484.1 prenyltransferase [Flavobacterium sp. Sd200]
MKLIKLFGLQNVLLLALGMFIFKYGFLDLQAGTDLALNQWQYGLMVLAFMLIAAGGAFINNVAGVGKENTTKYSESTAYNIYIALTLVGVGLGYYIANFTGRPMFSGVFIAGAATLYIYATSLKQTILVSNILIALTIALPFVAIGVFTLFPMLADHNRVLLATLFDLMLDYALFVFAIGLLITMVKDLATIDEDYNAGITTLPIALGRARALKVALAFTIVPLLMLFYYGNKYIIDLTISLGYGLLFIAGPLVYFILKGWSAKTQKDFIHLETVLKIALFFTLLSITVITLNIQYNAKG